MATFFALFQKSAEHHKLPRYASAIIVTSSLDCLRSIMGLCRAELHTAAFRGWELLHARRSMQPSSGGVSGCFCGRFAGRSGSSCCVLVRLLPVPAPCAYMWLCTDSFAHYQERPEHLTGTFSSPLSPSEDICPSAIGWVHLHESFRDSLRPQVFRHSSTSQLIITTLLHSSQIRPSIDV